MRIEDGSGRGVHGGGRREEEGKRVEDMWAQAIRRSRGLHSQHPLTA